MEASMRKILAFPVKNKAMKEALSNSKNRLADTLMYAEFADLSENDFKDICLFSEHDWMMFNECSEEEQQKEPVYILSEDAFFERVKTPSRLTYTLYKSMRKLQNVKEEFPVKEGLSEEDMIKSLKERGYKIVKDDVPADVSEPMEEVYQVIKSLDKSWIFFHLTQKVKEWCEDLKQSAIEYSQDQARCALCGEDLSKRNAYISVYSGISASLPVSTSKSLIQGFSGSETPLAAHLKNKNNDAK